MATRQGKAPTVHRGGCFPFPFRHDRLRSREISCAQHAALRIGSSMRREGTRRGTRIGRALAAARTHCCLAAWGSDCPSSSKDSSNSESEFDPSPARLGTAVQCSRRSIDRSTTDCGPIHPIRVGPSRLSHPSRPTPYSRIRINERCPPAPAVGRGQTWQGRGERTEH